MKRIERKIRIKSLLIKYFLIYTLIMTLVSIILICLFTIKSSYQKTEELYNELGFQISERLNSTMDSINNTAVGIMFNTSIQGMLIDPSILNRYEDQNIINSVLFDFRNFLDVGNIVIFSLEGEVLTASEGYDRKVKLEDFDWYEDVKESKGQSIWETSHVDKGDYKYKSEPVITLVKKIRRIDTEYNIHTGEDLGYIMINIGEKEINDIISKTQWERNNTFYISDENGVIISSSNSDLVGTNGINPNVMGVKRVYFDYSNKEMVIIRSLSISNWYLIGIVPWYEITKNNEIIFGIMITATLIASMVFIGVAIRLSNRISGPLHQLYTHMGYINNLETMNQDEYEISHITEIDSLVDGYQNLIFRLKYYIEEAFEAKSRETELKALAKEAELEALQHQINPHFLYNTLDSINWMASLEGNDEIVEMVTRLGDLLRFSMKKEQYVTIEEEVENVQNYIHIQSVRYDNKFNFIKEVDKGILDCHIMKLILQPIIENSFLHGLRQIDHQGIITLKILKNGEKIRLEVSDNGKGMTEETLRNLRDNIKENAHIGLYNVYERLKLKYQDDLNFQINSTLNHGTTIIIEISKY